MNILSVSNLVLKFQFEKAKSKKSYCIVREYNKFIIIQMLNVHL